MASADLLLHPVRLRIVQAFLGDRALTTAQLVAERRVRAVVERTYMLRILAAQIQPDEVAAMTPEQHLQAFVAYVAGMLTAAERYLTTGTPDPARDGASYRMGALWLTDAEFADLIRDLQSAFGPRLANAPGKGRRRRMVYTVLLPAPEEPPPTPKRRASGRKPRPRDKEGS